MNPMIKYRGGKSKELPQFEKYIPTDYDTYFEPFIGGGAVFFHLQPPKAVISDINHRLINFYSEMQTNYTDARIQLDHLQILYETNQKQYNSLKKENPTDRVENKNEALYYTIRNMFNRKIPSEYLDSVIYYFINKSQSNF